MTTRIQSEFRVAKACALALFAAGLSTFVASNAQAAWEELGCVEVGRRADFDVINVGKREGAFTKLRVRVLGNDVNFELLRVVYGNGAPDNLPIRSEFRENTTSGEIDLKGNARRIDRIEMVSRKGFKGRGRGRAKVCVSGFSVPARGRPQASWERLGCQRVGFLKDRDSIQVGRREGAFKSIRLEVSGNDIRMDNLTIIYGNGTPDRINVNQTIREGVITSPISLSGRKRVINRIDMVYKAKPNFKGLATVCVSGLQ